MTDRVDNVTASSLANVRGRQGRILFENGGLKVLDIKWDPEREQCQVKTRFQGMVDGTNLDFTAYGTVWKFNYNKDGTLTGSGTAD